MSARCFWRVALTAGDAGVPRFVAALEPFCDSVAWTEAGAGLWRIEGTARRAPDRRHLEAALAEAAGAGIAPPAVVVERLPDRDWLAENRQSLAPIRAGRYYVHGAHVAPPPADGRIALKIDAGLAFGSGSHESTRGCLLALDGLARRSRRFRRPLDLGTGSGILAIAMAKTWRVPVLAADIDPVALRVARENARANGAGGAVRVVLSDGWRHVALRRSRACDLVTANILAAPLRRMAPQFAARVASGGIVVLSGLLAAQEAEVSAAYRMQGFTPVRRIVLGEWPTLVFRR